MNPLTKDLGEVLKDLPEDPDSRTLYLLFKSGEVSTWEDLMRQVAADKERQPRL
jgi:hypothetical protein